MNALLPQSFSYGPLIEAGAIRLFILHPGIAGSDIHGMLIHTTVDECRNDIYDHSTSLSYVWGDPARTKTIFVDCQPFQDTVNLAAALDDLRDADRPLRMWVDAICIDQKNTLERNTQVVVMRYIYSIAQQTVVYLGKSDTKCDEILATLRSGTASEDVKNSAITEILSRPWFTRVWVYQELKFCRGRFGFSVVEQEYCGTISKDNDLMALLTSMHVTRERFKISLIDGQKSPSLKHILSHRREFGVSDLRDIIYGHLALAGLSQSSGDAVILFPTVEYSKSVSEVFTDATAYIYTSSDHIDLLMEVEAAEPSIRGQDLPSWVPNWALNPSKLLPSIPPEYLEQTKRFPDDTHKEVYCFRNLSVLAFKSFEFTVVEEASTFISPSLTEIWQRECEVYEKMVHDFNATGTRDTILPSFLETGEICHRLHRFWQRQFGDGFLPHLDLKTLIPKVSVAVKTIHGDKEKR